jgi:hypothetical protein
MDQSQGMGFRLKIFKIYSYGCVIFFKLVISRSMARTAKWIVAFVKMIAYAIT